VELYTGQNIRSVYNLHKNVEISVFYLALCFNCVYLQTWSYGCAFSSLTSLHLRTPHDTQTTKYVNNIYPVSTSSLQFRSLLNLLRCFYVIKYLYFYTFKPCFICNRWCVRKFISTATYFTRLHWNDHAA